MTATAGATRPAAGQRRERSRPAPVRRVPLRDDRWADWLATFAFGLSAVVVVAWLVPPLS